MKNWFLIVLFLVAAFFLYSCGSSDVQQLTTTTTTTLPPVVYNFNAAAAVGDLLTYFVDVTNLTYSYNNITEGTTGSGTYTVNSNGTFSLSSGGTGMMLTAEVVVIGIPGSSLNTIIVGVPTITASYGASADGVYNFVNSYSQYGTFEVFTSTRTVKFHELSTGTSGTGTYTDEGTGIIKYTAGGKTTNVMLLPGKVIVEDHPDGMTVAVAATTEYGSDLAGTYRWVDNEGSHGTFTIYFPSGVSSMTVGDKTTFEGTAINTGGTTNFTGEAEVLANGSFFVKQYNPTSSSSKDAIFLPGKVIAFNNRADNNYLGFGVKF